MSTSHQGTYNILLYICQHCKFRYWARNYIYNRNRKDLAWNMSFACCKSHYISKNLRSSCIRINLTNLKSFCCHQSSSCIWRRNKEDAYSKIQEATISCNKLTGQQGKALKEHTLSLTNHKSQLWIVPDIYVISLFSDSLVTFQDPVKALLLHPLQHLLSSSSNYSTSFPQFFL